MHILVYLGCTTITIKTKQYNIITVITFVFYTLLLLLFTIMIRIYRFYGTTIQYNNLTYIKYNCCQSEFN